MPVLNGADPTAVETAALRLAAGGLVAFPTETVYGLGARADDDAATRLIFAAKGRPADHPLIVHVADAACAASFAAHVSESARRLMSAFWPGPVTLIVARRAGVAGTCAGGLPTVGLRCPDHAVAQALLRRTQALGVPGVAAPSANRFGRVSPTRSDHVVAEFGPDLMVLDGGECREGIESTIVDCTRAEPRLLRPGTTSRAALETALGRPLLDRDAAAPRVSGSLESHYAPQARVWLCAADELGAAVASAVARGAVGAVGVYSRSRQPGFDGARYRAMPDNARGVAHELFAVLHQFDAEGVNQIWVETPPSQTEWDGVRDRLQRAAANR
jgi:L-threonylcarbamoyladenylate synthase